jgi:hypothetical protein
MVFWSLYHENRSSRYLPRSQSSPHGHELPSGHHLAFLIYPFIYIACTSPLAVARLMTTNGGSPSVTYYCIAGLTLATNGFWNTILWSTTMLFSNSEDMRNTGLDQFASIRTPASRRYGNMIWINGPFSKVNEPTNVFVHDVRWWWKQGRQTRWKGTQSRNTSQQPLGRDIHARPRGNCIRMDIITTVLVEENNDAMSETTRVTSTTTSSTEKKSTKHVSEFQNAAS